MEKSSKLIEAEKLESGSVKMSVYCDYIRAISVIGTVITLASYLASNGFTVATNVWLSEWANDALDPERSKNDTALRDLRLTVYGLLGIGQTVFVLVATITLNLSCLRGSTLLHASMLHNVIRAPMSFFDTTPMGRILNRFSKDVDTTDITLVFSLRLLIIELFRAIVTVIIISTGTPMILTAFLPLSIMYYLLQV